MCPRFGMVRVVREKVWVGVQYTLVLSASMGKRYQKREEQRFDNLQKCWLAVGFCS